MGVHATDARKLGGNDRSDRGKVLREVSHANKEQSFNVSGGSKQLAREENGEDFSEAEEVEEVEGKPCEEGAVEVEESEDVDEEEGEGEVEEEEEAEEEVEEVEEMEEEVEEVEEVEEDVEEVDEEVEVEEDEAGADMQHSENCQTVKPELCKGDDEEEMEEVEEVEEVGEEEVGEQSESFEEVEVEECEEEDEEEEEEEVAAEVEESCEQHIAVEVEEEEKVDAEPDRGCEEVEGKPCEEGAVEAEEFEDVDEDEGEEEVEEVEEEEEEEVEEVEEVEEMEGEVEEVEEVEEDVEEVDEEEEVEEDEAGVDMQHSENCQTVKPELCKGDDEEEMEEVEEVEEAGEEEVEEQSESFEEVEVEECEEEDEDEEEEEEAAAEVDESCEQHIAVEVGETCVKHASKCETNVAAVNEKQSDKSSKEKKSFEIVTPPSSERKEMLDLVQSSSNENKRMADVMLSSSGKKLRKENASNGGDSPSNMQDKSAIKSGGCETSGSSGKKRGSRWDIPEDAKGGSEGGTEVTKRKKTRWADDDTELKMIGPLQLPDFTKGIGDGTKHEQAIKKLNEQLLAINQELLSPDTSDMVRSMLIAEKQKIISKLVKGTAIVTSCKEEPPLLCKKLYIPVKVFPDYNFIGLIMGPGGKNQKKMESETGARILLRGKGSVKQNAGNTKPEQSESDELHVRIEADNEDSLDAAVSMVEKLLVPEAGNSLKLEQLREIAFLKGTLHPSDLCQICGEINHPTRYCPLTTRSPTTDCQSSNNLSQIADGFFSSFCGKPGPSNNTSGINSDAGNKIVQKHPLNESNLYVGSLPQNIDEAVLVQLFSPFGSIDRVRVVRDLASGVSKGYGFVKYKSPVCAAAAIQKMNMFPISNNTLIVRLAGPAHATSSVNPVNMPMGKTSSHLGSSTISVPQVAPCWRNAPTMMLPGYRMPYPQMGNVLANGSFVSHPYATPMLPSPGSMATMEIENFAGNPNKTATSLFSSVSTKTSSGTNFKDHKAPTQGQVTMSRVSHSPVHTPNVPSSETVSFPGNPEYFKSPYQF